MPFLVYSCFLFFLLLQGCDLEVTKPMRQGQSGSAVGAQTVPSPTDTDPVLQVADDQTAGKIGPRIYRYRDPATGTEYEMNSGWRILPRQPRSTAAKKALAKASGLIQTWTDSSGRVETRIYECLTPALAQHQSLGCQVEQDFVLVGGGAYADYGTGTGALLWESRPLDKNLFTWVASSKDHKAPNPHRLYVYAIGMRLKASTGGYVPRANLASMFKVITWNSYPETHYPHIEAKAPLLIAAGARTNWTCCGSLLTRLKTADYQPFWTYETDAKDHGDAELTTITGYAIEAPSYIGDCIDVPGFGLVQFRGCNAQGGAVGTGVAVAQLDVESGWALVSMGGEANWTTGPGRLLFGIRPTGTYQGQAAVYSKDHRAVSGGFNRVTLTEARMP
jgi:hypothetical protein